MFLKRVNWKNEASVRKFRTSVRREAESKVQESTIKYYKLDDIISVGYRVKSQGDTQFRKVQNKNYESDFDKKVMQITKEGKTKNN